MARVKACGINGGGQAPPREWRGRGVDLGIYSAFPGAPQLPPDGNRNPLQRSRILQRLLNSSCFPDWRAYRRSAKAACQPPPPKKERKKETSRRGFIVTRRVYVGFLWSRVHEDSEGVVTGEPSLPWKSVMGWCSWLRIPPWAALARDWEERGCAGPGCSQPLLAMQMCPQWLRNKNSLGWIQDRHWDRWSGFGRAPRSTVAGSNAVRCGGGEGGAGRLRHPMLADWVMQSLLWGLSSHQSSFSLAFWPQMTWAWLPRELVCSSLHPIHLLSLASNWLSVKHCNKSAIPSVASACPCPPVLQQVTPKQSAARS